MSSLFVNIEAECADRLSANALISAAGIPVHVDPQKNVVATVIDQVQRTKMIIVPLVASGKVDNPNQHGPVFEPIRIEVGVFQNPALSGNLPAPREVAEEVCSMNGLHLFEPTCIPSRVCCTGFEQVTDRLINIYSCHFECKGGMGGRFTLVQCAVPVWDGGSGTLSCTTAGAAIFYTVDGSRPAPRNGLIALGALGLTGGAMVRARAFLAGYLNSDELRVTI